VTPSGSGSLARDVDAFLGSTDSDDQWPDDRHRLGLALSDGGATLPEIRLAERWNRAIASFP